MTFPSAPTPDGAPEPAPGVRASDDDRTAVVAVLHDAVARGLLTLDECDERVAAAYAARFVHARAPLAPGGRAVAVLLWLQLRPLLNASTWRGITRAARSRPRLAIAVAGLL